MKDYYKILLISKSATLDEIKHSFRFLAHKYHPDKNNGNKQFLSRFIEIKEAYDLLSDINKRKGYDKEYINFFSSSNIYEKEFNDFFSSNYHEDYKRIILIITKYDEIDSGKIVLEELKRNIEKIIDELPIMSSVELDRRKFLIELISSFVNIVLNKTDEIINDILEILLVSPADNIMQFTNEDRMIGVLSWVDSIFVNVINPLESIELDFSTKEKFFMKKQFYTDLKTKLKSGTSHKNSSSACYIATMVYGSYNDINVIILREFRDTVLSKFIIGKYLINLYYSFSPYFVNFFKYNKTIKSILKLILDFIVKCIITMKPGYDR